MTAAYRRAGLNDNAIRNLIAKNAGESGWGRSAQGSYNFGNITIGKSWNGKYVKGKDSDGNGNTTSNYFRAYDSLDDYVRDEIQFLTRLYDFNPNDDIVTFTHKLQGGNKGGRYYAGAKNYAQFIQSIYQNVKI
jgi:flagellum-specific peptidoglycan hydrolase FlgJ